MKTNIAKLLIVVVLCLGIAVIVLFKKNSTLDERLLNQQNLFEKEQTAKTAEMEEVKQTIAKLEAALVQNTSADKACERILTGEVNTLKEEITKGSIETKKSFSKIDTALAKIDDVQRNSLAGLRDDVAKGVNAALTKQIVTQASETVVKSVLDDQLLIKDELFLKSVAKSLVDNYRDRLRGVSGADADNEKVAGLLKKDPEFLDLVSTTALIMKDEKRTEKLK